MSRLRPIPPRAIKVPLPDTSQRQDYTCGASCFKAIADYFGVLPADCEESDLVSLMGVARDVGAHPHNILTGIREFGLRHEEHFEMSDTELFRCLGRGIPVMLMIQAWRDVDHRRRRWDGWLSEFDEGHWVAAIGYDREGIYFEDPSIEKARGFLTYEDLFLRWHDVGPYWIKPYTKHMHQYGLAIWGSSVLRRPHEPRHRLAVSIN